MCLPVAAAGIALSGMQTAGLALSAATAIAANEQKKRMAEAQSKAIAAQFAAQANLLTEQQNQIGDAAQQKESELARQINAERARLATTAGEYGVSGNTLDRLNTELSFRGQGSLDSIDINRDHQLAQSALQGQALRADAQTKINSLDKGLGPLGLGLQIMGLGMDTLGKGTPIPGSSYTGLLKG